jgi:hypothetical protein
VVDHRPGCGVAFIWFEFIEKMLGLDKKQGPRRRRKAPQGTRQAKLRQSRDPLVVDMRNNVSERVTSLRTLTLMTDPADMEPELNRFKEQTAKYDVSSRNWPRSSPWKPPLKRKRC